MKLIPFWNILHWFSEILNFVLTSSWLLHNICNQSKCDKVGQCRLVKVVRSPFFRLQMLRILKQLDGFSGNFKIFESTSNIEFYSILAPIRIWILIRSFLLISTCIMKNLLNIFDDQLMLKLNSQAFVSAEYISMIRQ